MSNKDKIEEDILSEALSRIQFARNKIEEDLLNYGISIHRERDGKIDYIDPMSPEGEKILKLHKESKK